MRVENSPVRIQSHFVIRNGGFAVAKGLVKPQEEIDFPFFTSWATGISKRMREILFGGMELEENFYGVIDAHLSCPQIKNRRLLRMAYDKFFQEDPDDWEIEDLPKLENLISPQLVRHVFELTEGIIEDILELKASPQSPTLLVNDSNLSWLFKVQLTLSGIFLRSQLKALTPAQNEAIGKVVLPKNFGLRESPRLSELLAIYEETRAVPS